MTLYKPIKGTIKGSNKIEIETETGHRIIFNLNTKIFVDLENKTERNLPFFFVTFEDKYSDTIRTKKSLSLKQIQKKYKDTNLLTPELEYDHIQIGFVYSDNTDPNNHRWMLNFMDVNNNFLFGYNGDSIKVNCPFTTISWEDGIWHGRFAVYKKDVTELLEPNQGQYVLNGSGSIGDHIVTPIKENMDNMSLRYDINNNTWYCDYRFKDKIVGSTPCKNIICDVPFEGKVDRTFPKPKVTAELKIQNIKGITVALNALIIKAK